MMMMMMIVVVSNCSKSYDGDDNIYWDYSLIMDRPVILLFVNIREIIQPSDITVPLINNLESRYAQ